MIAVHTRLRVSSRGGLGRENIKLSPVSGGDDFGNDDDDVIDIDNKDSQLVIVQYLRHTNSSRRWQRIGPLQDSVTCLFSAPCWTQAHRGNTLLHKQMHCSLK